MSEPEKYSLEEFCKISKIINKSRCDCRCWFGCVIVALIAFAIMIAILFHYNCKPTIEYPCALKPSAKDTIYVMPMQLKVYQDSVSGEARVSK
jgi:hypothetical protein